MQRCARRLCRVLRCMCSVVRNPQQGRPCRPCARSHSTIGALSAASAPAPASASCQLVWHELEATRHPSRMIKNHTWQALWQQLLCPAAPAHWPLCLLRVLSIQLGPAATLLLLHARRRPRHWPGRPQGLAAEPAVHAMCCCHQVLPGTHWHLHEVRACRAVPGTQPT